jgi:hypothetical protein
MDAVGLDPSIHLATMQMPCTEEATHPAALAAGESSWLTSRADVPATSPKRRVRDDTGHIWHHILVRPDERARSHTDSATNSGDDTSVDSLLVVVGW